MKATEQTAVVGHEYSPDSISPWEDISYDGIVVYETGVRFQANEWPLPKRLGQLAVSIKFNSVPWEESELTPRQRKYFLWSLKCYVLARMRPRAEVRRIGAFGTILREMVEIKRVVVWLLREGHVCFGAFNDSDVVEKFVAFARRSAQSKHHLSRILAPIVAIFETRERMPMRSRVNAHPFNGVAAGRLAQYRGYEDSVPHPHLPDDIAIPVLEGCLRMIRQYGDEVLEIAREWKAALSIVGRGEETECARTRRIHAALFSPYKDIQSKRVRKIAGRDLTTLIDVRNLLNDLRNAAIIVINCFCGPRLGEILALKPGCLSLGQESADGTLEIFWLNGLIFKNASGHGQGRPHVWVAGARPVDSDVFIPVHRAVEVLEELRVLFRPDSPTLVISMLAMDSYREASPRRGCGASIRRIVQNEKVSTWDFTTTQFRKTCGHFLGRRHKYGLGLVGELFGHTNLAMSLGYAGTDVDLNADYISEISEEAARELLEFANGGGVAGAAGELVNGPLMEFRAMFLVEAEFVAAVAEGVKNCSLILVPGDWGACFYRRACSECGGGASGPNYQMRSVDLCLKCKNIGMSKHHRSYHSWRVDYYSLMLTKYPEAAEMHKEEWTEKRDSSQQCIRQIDALKQHNHA